MASEVTMMTSTIYGPDVSRKWLTAARDGRWATCDYITSMQPPNPNYIFVPDADRDAYTCCGSMDVDTTTDKSPHPGMEWELPTEE